MDCWHRFNEKKIPTLSESQALSSATSESGKDNVQHQSQDNNTGQVTALLTHHDLLQTPQDSEAQTRFADSGASHHITPYV